MGDSETWTRALHPVTPSVSGPVCPITQESPEEPEELVRLEHHHPHTYVPHTPPSQANRAGLQSREGRRLPARQLGRHSLPLTRDEQGGALCSGLEPSPLKQGGVGVGAVDRI